ncbi:MAG: hypothetical protein JKY51_06315 [Opitutaceae bacterium]|nr:hypothetical protein [Opitutaceae bacterium]
MMNPTLFSSFLELLRTKVVSLNGWKLLLLGAFLVSSGCQTTKKLDFEPVLARFYIEMNPSEGYNQPVTLPLSGISLAVHPSPVFSETEIVKVDLVRVDLGLCLSFYFNEKAGRKLYRLTVNNQSKRLVLSLNNASVGVRTIDQPFSSGNILIFVELPDEELEELVDNLKKTTEEIQGALRKSRN